MRPVDDDFSAGQMIPGTRYRVVRRIGTGGMGTVFDVEHMALGKRFVLKVLKAECARRPDLVARLRNEWRALGQLQHPNIVAATDAGDTANGIPFFVMERLEGEPLARRMRAGRRLGTLPALEIAIEVLEGLSAAHQIGIVHRDIKPPNIFLTTGGGVKILDFGVAKFDNPDAKVVTAHGVAIGTPRYMSPEQANAAPVDGRADLYATGLILFEMIAGRSPFEEARNTNELIVAHLARPAPRLSSIAPKVSAELDDVVVSLLAKDPRDRPASCRQVATVLRWIVHRERIVAPTDATTQQRLYAAPPSDALVARESSAQASDAVQPWVSGPGDDDCTTHPRGQHTMELGSGASACAEAEGLADTSPMDSMGWESRTTDTRSGETDDFVTQGTPSDDVAYASSYRVDTDFDPRTYDPADDSSAGAEPTHEPTLELDEPDATDDPVELGTETHTAVPLRDPSLSETPPPVTPLDTATRDAARGRRWRRWGPVALAGATATATLVAWLVVVDRSDRAADAGAVDPAPAPAAMAVQPAQDEPTVVPIADLTSLQEPGPVEAAPSASVAAVPRAASAPSAAAGLPAQVRRAARPSRATLFPPPGQRQSTARSSTDTARASPSRAPTPQKTQPTRLNLPGSGL